MRYILRARHISADGKSPAAGSLDFQYRLVELGLRARGNGHCGSFGSKSDSDRLAEAAPPSGYERHLSCEFFCHSSPALRPHLNEKQEFRIQNSEARMVEEFWLLNSEF
jgi:hypothetical protein